MTRLPALKPREVVRIVERAGFVFSHQKGSHRKFRHPSGRTTIVPLHNRDIKRGLLKRIIKDTGLSEEEFLKHR